MESSDLMMELRSKKITLEIDIKRQEEFKDLIMKEKMSLQQTNKYLIKEIKDVDDKMILHQKKITFLGNQIKKSYTVEDQDRGKVALSSNEETVQKHFYEIQKMYSMSLYEKLKTDVIELLKMQLETKISYIIIKKIEFKDEFIDNLLNKNNSELAKNNSLGFYYLKNCGPCLIYRLLEETTLESVKNRCCQYWGINPLQYHLYDEAFNNLEACKKARTNEFFEYYEPSDSTLKEGEVAFYLIEKMKTQQSVNSKSDAKAESNSGGGNSSEKDKLETCIQLFRQNKILYGLRNYKARIIEEGSGNFYKDVRMTDNNCVFLFVAIIYIKDVYYWAAGVLQNKLIYEANSANMEVLQFIDMKDWMYCFYNFITTSIKLENKLGTSSFFFGPIRLRFIKCYYPDHTGDKINKTTINPNIIYLHENATDSDIPLDTAIGLYDGSGHILDIYPDDINYLEKLNVLKAIIDNPKISLNNNLRAVELSYNTFDPNIDLFIASDIIIERNILNVPFMSKYDSIGFKTNSYETISEKIAEYIDYARIGLLVQKGFASRDKRSKDPKWCKNIYNTMFQIKTILIIFSTGFLVYAVIIFKLTYVNCSLYMINPVYINFYNFALEQRIARGLNVLSFMLISVYTLKFLQLFDSMSIIMMAFKKSFLEYILLSSITIVMFTALTIFMHFLYAPYIYEYYSFGESFLTNIKIFIFSENTELTREFPKFFGNISILVCVLFIVVLKYVLLMLYYPIFIEYYRMESDKYYYRLKPENDNDDDGYEDNNENKESNDLSINNLEIKLFFCGGIQLLKQKQKPKKEEEEEIIDQGMIEMDYIKNQV